MPAQSLVAMFNKDIDFVKRIGDSEYEEAEGPLTATHRLEATAWNTRDKYLRNSKNGVVITQKGYALSVVAEPLKIRFKKTNLKVKRKFPTDEDAPAYKAKGGLSGKRMVLRILCVMMGTPPKLTKLTKSMNDVDCDILYRNLIRASRIKFNQ